MREKKKSRRILFIFIKATPVTVCPTDFCKNNGQCTFDYTLNRLRCACPGTFSGKYCEIPIGNNTKKINLSQTLTTLSRVFSGQSNACASSPCYNGGSCTPAGASFLCTCKPQYTGPQCSGAISGMIIAKY